MYRAPYDANNLMCLKLAGRCLQYYIVIAIVFCTPDQYSGSLWRGKEISMVLFGICCCRSLAVWQNRAPGVAASVGLTKGSTGGFIFQ